MSWKKQDSKQDFIYHCFIKNMTDNLLIFYLKQMDL